ncbi:MAG: hypothetical protein JWO15_3579 [Sphingomonadales bacterium]|nr:hypothetical protein [Sphingomonadales bacterium]
MPNMTDKEWLEARKAKWTLTFSRPEALSFDQLCHNVSHLSWLEMWAEEFSDGTNYDCLVVPPGYDVPCHGHIVDAKGKPAYSTDLYNQIQRGGKYHSLFGPFCMFVAPILNAFTGGSHYRVGYWVLGYPANEDEFLPMYWARRLGKLDNLENLLGAFMAVKQQEYANVKR